MDLFWPVWRALLEGGCFFALAFGLKWLLARTNTLVEIKAKSWPYTKGTVEHAEARTEGEGKSAHWVGELTYSYSVDGQYYAGFRQLPASSEDHAWDLVKGWKGSRLIVHYRQDKPEVSFIIMSEQNPPVLLAQ